MSRQYRLGRDVQVGDQLVGDATGTAMGGAFLVIGFEDRSGGRLAVNVWGETRFLSDERAVLLFDTRLRRVEVAS